jgi:hypothetical protein
LELAKAPRIRSLPKLWFSGDIFKTSFSSSGSTSALPWTSLPGVGRFKGEEETKPAQQRLRSHDGRKGPETAATDHLGLARQAHALDIGEAFGLASELFGQDSLLLPKSFDNDLLLPIDPAGDHDKEELQLCAPGQQRNVKAAGPQASTSLQPNDLALQE